MKTFSPENPSLEDHPDTKREKLKKKQEFYFSCYTDLAIHEVMLKDKARTMAYKHAIDSNKHLFKGKTVLDVGAGTLVLSLFAAKYADTVYAAEYAGINRFCEEICELNQDGRKIVPINAKAEDIDNAIDQVDIIVSEWMGYGLFFQDMVNTVLSCIKQWLKPGGMVFPQKASIHLAAASNPTLYHDNVTFWDDVYGLVMSPCKTETLTQMHALDCSNSVLLDSCKIYDLDLLTRKEEFQKEYFSSQFELMGEGIVDHLVIWFDVEFPGGSVLSTSPKCPVTHWKQCVIFLERKVQMKGYLKGEISFLKHPFHTRKVAVWLKYQCGETSHQGTYFMI